MYEIYKYTNFFKKYYRKFFKTTCQNFTNSVELGYTDRAN